MTQTILVGNPTHRVRQLGAETLMTKQIKEITVVKGERNKEYLVRLKDGTVHRMESVSQNPQYVVMYNGEPLNTCSDNYTPLFNSEIKDIIMETLEGLNKAPVSVQEKYPREHQYRMTAVVEQNHEVPVGHFRNGEMFDWGIGVTNSYDLSMGVHLYLYVYRQVCNNGLFAWSVSNKMTFIHVEKENKPELILDKIGNGVTELVTEHGVFFDQLKEMSTISPSIGQVKLLMKRIGVRKYEANILADHGITVEFGDKSEVKEVSLSTKVNSEFDLLNAITAMSNDVNTTARQFELQTGITEKILRTRTIVPDL